MLDDRTRLVFPSSGAVDLPLLFEPQLLRCTAAGPGGPPLTVLLDTGTDPSIIDLRLARRLGLRLGEFALGRDALRDDVPFTETVIPWLRLGDLYLRDLFALAVDLSTAPFQVDIVLGYNVLWQVVLHIDYLRRVVRLAHPDLGVSQHSAAGALVPMTFAEHFPALTDVTLCESIHLPLVTLDTGSNAGLTLGPDLAARLHLTSPSAAAGYAQGSGFAGERCATICGQAETLQVGPFALHAVELDSPGSGAGDLRQVGRANMGNRLLARFASVTLDYGRGLCALEHATVPTPAAQRR
jgi:hypothetical protein